jgi:arginine-tRNA-protein transferase
MPNCDDDHSRKNILKHFSSWAGKAPANNANRNGCFRCPSTGIGSLGCLVPATSFIVVRSATLWHAAASATAGNEPGEQPSPGNLRVPGVGHCEGERTAMDIGAGSTRSTGDRARPQGSSASAGRRPLVLPTPPPQFYATTSVPCPYLPGHAERKLIVELGGRGAPGFYDTLSRVGFRRSHRFAYRPACRACAACVPVRIAVEQFAPTRSIRRVHNAHASLAGEMLAPRATVEQFRLFVAYQHARHRDSEMALMSYGDYRGMLEETALRTAVAEFRDTGGKLVGVSLFDRLDDGISAVYTFYDPVHRPGGLGTWSILWLVEECRRQRLPYVYLGYWIAESPKMAYKARFPALERLNGGDWVPFVPSKK